jgi:hypothetical protein
VAPIPPDEVSPADLLVMMQGIARGGTHRHEIVLDCSEWEFIKKPEALIAKLYENGLIYLENDIAVALPIRGDAALSDPWFRLQFF